MPVAAYGKYPGKRDYIVVNLPQGVLQPLENWLRTALSVSREALGARWQEHYMVQPVWDFWLGSGVVGKDCMGSIVPSVDGIGRPFPMVILAHAHAGGHRFALPDSLEDDVWFAEVHRRLMLALSDTPPRDPGDLVAGLQDPPPAGGGGQDGLQPSGHGFRWFWDGDGYEGAAARMRALHDHCRNDGRTIWWTAGGSYVAPQSVSFEGMPDTDFMTQMMASANSVREIETVLPEAAADA